MRIDQIHVYHKHLKVQGGSYTMAGTELDQVETTILKVVADNGLIGWGEACPLGATYQPEHALGVQAAIAYMAPNLIGQSFMQPLQLQRRMNALLNGHNSAKAAIDIAGLDLMGKQLGLRVCELLGGSNRVEVPSYYALGLSEPDETARQAKQKVAEGYTRLQLKIGGRDIETDVAAIRKVWEAIGTKAKLVVDANRGLSARDTMILSQQCASVPMTIEQPCNTMEEIGSVRPRLQHPLFLDEHAVDLNAVLRAMGDDLCDGFGLKVTRLGGLSGFAKVRDICEARSMPITCDDSFGGDIIAAACVHGGATIRPDLLEGVWIADSYIEQHYDPGNGVEVVDGSIKLPVGVGLGVNPMEDRIGRLLASYS